MAAKKTTLEDVEPIAVAAAITLTSRQQAALAIAAAAVSQPRYITALSEDSHADHLVARAYALADKVIAAGEENPGKDA